MQSQTIYARHALTTDAQGQPSWQEDIAITVQDGTITDITEGQPHPQALALLLPTMPNVHSHAFQYAMAGQAEHRAGGDHFWSWRETMYQLAEQLTPDDQQAIATYAYIQMLKRGYGAVGEFHYLHGEDPLATSQAMIQAAKEAGMSLRLLPVLYMTGHFDGRALNERQERFGLELDAYQRLLEALNGKAEIGLSFHSLRAVPQEAMQTMLTFRDAALPSCPVHIHIAEQVKEVEDCQAYYGQRPVEWLLNHMSVDHHWCLVHATHMSQEEIRMLRKTRAVAGLCPITEANLGDGTFPTAAADLPYGIGSDSHIRLDPFEELRMLEYSQRLHHQQRNLFAADGTALFHGAVRGGGQALGIQGGINTRHPANFMSLNLSAPLFHQRSPERQLDTAIYTGELQVQHLWVQGKRVIEDGRHPLERQAAAAMKQTMEKLAQPS